MGVEPFDLDAEETTWGDAPGVPVHESAETPSTTPTLAPTLAPTRSRTARRRPTWVVLAVAITSAVASGAVTDLHVRAATAAAAATHDRTVARLVITDGTFLAGKADSTRTDAGEVRVAEALVSLQVVNAGPLTLTLLSVHGDGDSAGLRDVLGDGQPLPAATSTRVAVIGQLLCPRSRSVTVHAITVRIRSADGRVHTRRADHAAVSAWANGLQRACSQAITTP